MVRNDGNRDASNHVCTEGAAIKVLLSSSCYYIGVSWNAPEGQFYLGVSDDGYEWHDTIESASIIIFLTTKACLCVLFARLTW